MIGLRKRLTLRGWRALWASPDGVLLAHGDRLGVLRPSGAVEELARLRVGTGWAAKLKASHRLARRLFRNGFRAAIGLAGGRYLVADGTAIYEVDTLGSWRVSRLLPPGKRPLSFTLVQGISGFDSCVCYGDYGNNPGKGPMSIWARDETGRWSERFIFPAGAVNHVHGLAADARRGCVWILTGDYGEAAALWEARDGFGHVRQVASGQCYRSCRVFPLDEGLLYATDSHLEPNSIRLLRARGNTWSGEVLLETNGSCLTACSVGPSFAFSTAVEPGAPTGNLLLDLLDPRLGPGIRMRRCDLLVGTPKDGFERVLSWDADWWPKRLFGFSTLHLPGGECSPLVLAVTGAGVRGHDDVTEVFELVPASAGSTSSTRRES